MQRGLILAVAGVCGAVAFLWTLVARPPRRETPVVYAQPMPNSRGGRFAPGAMRLTEARSLEDLEEAVRAGEADFQTWMELAERRLGAGNRAGAEAAWKEVVTRAREAVERMPDRARGAYFAIGWASGKLGDREAERQAFEWCEPMYTRGSTDMPGNLTLLMRLGWARQGLGKAEEAKAAWQAGESNLDALDAQTLDSSAWYSLACFRSLLGKTDAALEALARAVDKGYWNAEEAAGDDALASLTHDDRFAALLQKMRQQRPRPPAESSPVK